MKIFVRYKIQGGYVGKNGNLVGSEADAREFENTTEAEDYCREHRIQGVAVIRVGKLFYEVHLAER